MEGIASIISKHRKEKGLKQPELADLLARSSNLRITNKAVSSWEHGLTEPNATVFMHLCKILEIPDCVEEFFGKNPADPMAVLNDKGKEVARQYISLLAKTDGYSKDPGELHMVEPGVPISDSEKSSSELHLVTDIRKYRTWALDNEDDDEQPYIPLYVARPSAGTGEYMDSNSYSMIPVSKRISRLADFAVTIHGDSMEPEFHDHQMVYVNSKAEITSGDIGIFYLDGMTYIKKYQCDEKGVFLISLNKKYDPISVSEAQIENDSFRFFGKVCRF